MLLLIYVLSGENLLVIIFWLDPHDLINLFQPPMLVFLNSTKTMPSRRDKNYLFYQPQI